MSGELAALLQDIVGERHVLTDPELRRGYEQDLTGRFGGRAAAVVRPASTEEVAAILRLCTARRMPVVTQGGNTGLVGGGVPRGGELVLSLTRLDDLAPVDAVTAQVTVGAGVTLERLQAHAHAAGFEVGIDLGARGTATIGGMVATNAGGGVAMRFGVMRAQVAGLEAVLADGTIVRRLSGLLKDNAGFDVGALLIGSEGALGVITGVTVRLQRRPARRVVALFGLDGLEDALRLVTALRDRVAGLTAADFFEQPGLEHVLRHRRLSPPFPRAHPAYVVIECAADVDPTEEVAEVVDDVGVVRDAAVADDHAGRAALWGYREFHNEAVTALGVPHKLDVSVRVGDVPRFTAEVRERLAAVDPAAEVVLYGHLGDGNVHVNVVGPPPEDERVDEAVLGLVARYRGSISAEHGVGVAKARHLGLSRSAEEIDVMRRLKRALDPAGVLNPGCVLAGEPGA